MDIIFIDFIDIIYIKIKNNLTCSFLQFEYFKLASIYEFSVRN